MFSLHRQYSLKYLFGNNCKFYSNIGHNIIQVFLVELDQEYLERVMNVHFKCICFFYIPFDSLHFSS